MIAQRVLAAVWWQRRLAAAAILRRLLYAAFICALLALATALAVAVVPRLFGYGTLVVHGGSMGERIPNGSLVFARWIPAEKVKVGDVILVREETAGDPARPKIHRVVWLEQNEGQVLVRTKGDTNETVDPRLHVLPSHLATPARTVPYLGYAIGFVQTPLGWVLLVLLPATLLSILTLRSVWAAATPPLDNEKQRAWAT